MGLNKILSDLIKYNRIKSLIFINIIVFSVFAIFGAGLYSIINTPKNLSSEYPHSDPPLNSFNSNFPISNQWLPTQARTAVLQILDLYDRHRLNNDIYPRTLICDSVFNCERSDISTLNQSAALLYARSVAINNSDVVANHPPEQSWFNHIKKQQNKALTKDLAALSKQMNDQQSGGLHYRCAFLIKVNALEQLNDTERQNLATACFKTEYVSRFKNNFDPQLDVDQIYRKIDDILSYGASNYNWIQDEIAITYQLNPSLNTTANNHAHYVIDLVANYFWEKVGRSGDDIKDLSNRIQRSYNIALSEYFLTKARLRADEKFPPQLFFTHLLATQRMIDLYENQNKSVDQLQRFKYYLLSSIHELNLNDNVGYNALLEMPLESLADLSFSYDQLYQSQVVSNQAILDNIRRAILDQIQVSHDGQFTGYFSSYEPKKNGSSYASFKLMENSLLSAFILQYYTLPVDLKR